MTFSFAYYVHDLSPFIVRFGERFGLHWYGFAYVLAFVSGFVLITHLARRGYGPLRPAQVGDFITAAAIFGVMLGGRLGYFLFYERDKLLSDPLAFFRLWDGGMSSHGGILGLVIFTWVYARRQGYSWPAVGDNLVVAAPLGLFFGRVANFINGELWGRVVPGLAPGGPGPWWAMQFPHELRPGTELFAQAQAATGMQDPAGAAYLDPRVRAVLGTVLPPRYPSQLIEAALEGAVLFTVLWLIRTRTRAPVGTLTGVFMAGYAVLRIIGEQFREPDVGIAFTLGLTRGQFLSLFMILGGAGFLAYAAVRRKPTPAPGERLIPDGTRV